MKFDNVDDDDDDDDDDTNNNNSSRLRKQEDVPTGEERLYRVSLSITQHASATKLQMLTEEFASDLGSGLLGEKGDRPSFVNSNQCTKVKKTLG